MDQKKQISIMVVGVGIASQLYVNMLVDGFIVAVSPILFAICLYLFKELSSVIAGFIVGCSAPVLRIIVNFVRSGDLQDSILKAWPDILFFFCFGLLYDLIGVGKGHTYPRYFVSVFLCDFLSNMVEMTVRLSSLPFQQDILQRLILIALARSMVLVLVAISIDIYKSVLEKKNREDRYKKMVVMVSVLSSEIYYMNKNMVQVETVMAKAFTLYQRMEMGGYPRDICELSLDIAKDVHELKKDYQRVRMGLQDSFIPDIDKTGMHIQNIVDILEMDILGLTLTQKSQVRFTYSVEVNFYVEQHFALMSVLRNLIINSLEAIGSDRGTISLHIYLQSETKSYCFDLLDDGPGIAPDELDVIFEPGYSTKFDDETGDIFRGVGLTLVRDLVEDKFRGTVHVESEKGSHTLFRVEIPTDTFVQEAKGEKH